MMPAAGPALKNQMVASMFVPHKDQDKTPEPTEWGLRIEEQEPFVAYVAAYGGFNTQGNIINATSKLSAELIAAGIPIERDFFYNYIYDPPFELDSRYKEILVVEAPEGKQHRQQQNIFDVESEPTVQTFRPADEEEMETFTHGKFLYDGREFRDDDNAREGAKEDADGFWVYGDGDELYFRDEVIDYKDRDYDIYYHDVLDEYEEWLEEHQGEILAEDEDMDTEYPMWPSSGFWWSGGDADATEQEQAEKALADEEEAERLAEEESERLYNEEAERMYKEDVEEDEDLLDYELDDFNEGWTRTESDRMPSGEDPWNYGASGYYFGGDGDGEYIMDGHETDAAREYPMRPSSGFWWSVNTNNKEEAERMFAEDVEEDEDLLDAELNDFNQAWTQAEIDRMPSDKDLRARTQAEIGMIPSDEDLLQDEAWSQADIDRMPSDEDAWSYDDYSEDYFGEAAAIETVSTFSIDLDMDIEYDAANEDYPTRPSEGFWWTDGEDEVQPSLKATANVQPEAASDASLSPALLTAIADRIMELLSEISFPGVDQPQKQQLQVSFPRKAYPLEEARPSRKTDLSELVKQAEKDETNFNTELKFTLEVVQEQPEVQPEAAQEQPEVQPEVAQEQPEVQPEVVQEQPEKKGVDERQQEEEKDSDSGSLFSGLLRIFNIRQ